MKRLFDNVGAAIIGYVAASLAAGFTYILLIAAGNILGGYIEVPSEMSAMQQFHQLVWFAISASVIIGFVALVPSLPVMAVLAVARRTDIVSYMAAGIAIGVSSVWIAARNIIFMDKLEVNWLIICAGAVAGAVYWGIFRKLALRERQAP